jgi:hypothetical protein
VQSSVAERSSQKLAFKYFGPYLVLQRVGKVAYRIQLPPSSRIHPVVHVSQLKKEITERDQVCPELPAYLLAHVLVQPLAITADRFIRRGSKQVPQVQVRWSGLPAPCLTWEPLFAIVNAFPSSPAWGHAEAQGGGNVTHLLLRQALKEKRRTDTRQ